MTVDEIERAVAHLPTEQFAEFCSWLERFELAQLSRSGSYSANADELRGIDRGLREAAEGKFASAEDVEATFARYRNP